MSQEVAIDEKSGLPMPVVERGLDKGQWLALKSSIFPGAESQSILLAVDYCKARGLDPLRKPVHIVPMRIQDAKSGDYRWQDVIMPGIAEYRTTAARTGLYAGQDDPEFGPTIDYKGVQVPEYCKVTVHKIVAGHICNFSHTEWFSEACATKRGGELNSMWTKRPHGQLAKCAEAGALRKAFPEEIGGDPTMEEMEGKVIDAEVVESYTPPYTPEQKNRFDDLIKAEDAYALRVFRQEIGDNAWMGLNGSFEHGTKGKMQAIVAEYETKGNVILSECVTAVQEAIAKDDFHSVLETIDLENEHEKALIMQRLTPEEQMALELMITKEAA